MARKHTHKYHKIDIATGKLWACALDDCNHYMPKHLENTVVGKGSICWNCGERFILTPQSMQNDMPLCGDCDPRAIKPTKIVDALKHLGIE